MTPKISFLIPTNRDPEQYVKSPIDSINRFGSNYSYEICVFSETEVKGENVVWHKEEKQAGPIAGFNHLISRSEGEYFFLLVDDHIFVNEFDLTIDYLNKTYKDKEHQICSLNPGNICLNPMKGQLCGDKLIDFEVFSYQLCRFPALHRNALTLLDGKIWNSSFIYHAADIWLGYFLGSQGRPSRQSPTYVEPYNPAKNSALEVEDCNVARKLMKKISTTDIPYSFQIK